MKTANAFFLIASFWSASAFADPQKVITCSTTQTYTWPIPDPNGSFVTESIFVSNQVTDSDPERGKLYAGQGAWKDCWSQLQQKFDNYWALFGETHAPTHTDDLGRIRPRPMEVCRQFVTNPEDYVCTETVVTQ